MTKNNGSYIFRRFFGAALALAVLLSVLPAWSLPAAAAETDFVPDSGSGDGKSMDTPYFISTEEQLWAIANNGSLWNSHFKLTADIDLGNREWTPIGNGKAFKGSFDGAKPDGGCFTVSGLSINVNPPSTAQGLFGQINGGIVKNLIVSGSVSVKKDPNSKDDYGIGGIVGRNDSGTIENCTNYVKVTGDGNMIGGVVGRNNGGTVDTCANYAEVTGTGNYIGGVVGLSENNSGNKVLSCQNYGAVNGNSSVGGVVGGTKNSTVTNCTNNKNVTGSGSMVGGVVGKCESGTISKCTNTINATVTGESDYAGGIVGKIENSSGTVQVCKNEAAVKGGDYVGGVAGENNGKVEICYNIGKVDGSKVKDGTTVDGNSVGGVVGHNLNTLENCYNTGAVKGGSNVGGIVGYNDKGSVKNCYNIGTITGGSNVGAALGQNSASVQNCFFFVRDAALSAIGSGTDSNSVKPATAEEFLTDSTFTKVGWGFGTNNVWKMGTVSETDNEPVRPVLVQIPETPLDPLPTVTPPSGGDNTGGNGDNGDNTGDGNDTDDGDNTGNGDTGNGGSTGGNSTGGGNNNNNPSQPPASGSNTQRPSTGGDTQTPPTDSNGAGDINIGSESGGDASETNPDTGITTPIAITALASAVIAVTVKKRTKL